MSLKLTRHQLESFNSVSEFLSDNSIYSRQFILTGFAGTGKSTICKEICARNKGSLHKFVFCAPTNKAAKLLASFLSSYGAVCKTIYSALGIVMSEKDDKISLQYPKNPIPLKNVKVLVVDECSMITGELFNYVITNYPTIKILFIGDPKQLPPVNEERSCVFHNQIESTSLTEVVRHTNKILSFASDIRECIDTNEIPIIRTMADETGGVHRLSSKEFSTKIQEYCDAGRFNDPDDARVVAWTNKRVEFFNSIIRKKIWGAAAKEEYIVGDIVMVASPVVDDMGMVLLSIDEEGTITSREVVEHSVYKNLKCVKLRVKFDVGPRTLHVIDPDSEYDLMVELSRLADAARKPKCGFLWSKFWALKNAFNSIRYAYAITSHRSQGSSFNEVFVDTSDILKNRNRNEALRCLYVACTRPRTNLFLM